ncbi:MAG: hypothetical protein HUK08_06530 [Bacteroidaceae bacterium]|nr:hypothetical protein [Bacteroidaceae bacterium]
MKKSILCLGALCIAALSFTSCNSAKQKQAAEEESVKLADSIRDQALVLYDEITAEKTTLMQDVVVLPEGVKVIEPKFFIPIERAEKAQTDTEKSALLGMYATDQAYNENSYGSAIKYDEREAVIKKLATDLNFEIPSTEEVDSGIHKSISAEMLRESLNSPNADKAVMAIVYSAVEATLNRQAIYESVNGYVDNIDLAKHAKKGIPTMQKTAKLISLLSPFYETLSPLQMLVHKLSKVTDAEEDSNEYLDAIIEFDNYVKELRAKITTEVNQ